MYYYTNLNFNKLFNDVVDEFAGSTYTAPPKITCELAGIKKENIKVEKIKDGRFLLIKVSTKQTAEDLPRVYTKRVPIGDIDTKAITCTYEDGLLTVTLPKKTKEEKEEGSYIKID